MAEVKIEDMKPNSYKSKEKKEAPKVTPVIDKDAVISTKKSLGQKFVDTFVNEDINDVKAWLLKDVVVPGVKNTILDILGMMFFGGNGGRSYGRRYYNRENVSYNNYYKSEYNGRQSYGYNRPSHRPEMSNDKVDYRNIIVRDREAAEDVVDQMRRRIADFGQVSIAEMLEFMSITGKYTDNNWGWHNPNDINIRRMPNGGWLIDVPEAEIID